MVVRTFKNIYAFFMVMLILLFGFTMAFVTMLPEQPRFQLPMALLTSFEMMLGAWEPWDLNQFDGQFDSYNNSDTSGGVDYALATLSVIAFGFYAVFVLVVGMNLPIAIMSDSYDRVRENQAVHGRIQQAETLVAMEWIVRRLWSKDECFPMFLHVLAAAEDDEGEDRDDGEVWGGRLKQLKKVIPNEVEQRMYLSEQRLKAEIVTMTEMKAVKAEIKAEMKTEFKEMRDLLLQLSALMVGPDARRRPDQEREEDPMSLVAYSTACGTFRPSLRRSVPLPRGPRVTFNVVNGKAECAGAVGNLTPGTTVTKLPGDPSWMFAYPLVFSCQFRYFGDCDLVGKLWVGIQAYADFLSGMASRGMTGRRDVVVVQRRPEAPDLPGHGRRA